MNKITIALLLFLLFQGNLKAQTTIDLHPKLLEKEINRINGETSTISELATPSEVASQLVLARFITVSSSLASNPIKFAFVGRVKTCRTGGCTINNTMSGEGESEYFDYFILYDSVCRVQLVKIYNYQATHGHEVSAKGWLKQYIGYNGTTELNVGKNIDAISGATISVNAITLDIEYRTGLLKQVLKL